MTEMSAISFASISSVRDSAIARRGNRVLPLPRVLLCDLDGTLIDTMPILADLATDVMAETYDAPRAMARELYLATCGLPFVQQLESIYPGDPRNAATAATFESRKPMLCRGARLTPETLAGLEEMRSLGVLVVVSSNNGTENVEAFAATNPEFEFDLLLGFGAGQHKGAPHLDTVSRTFGFTRKQMLFIGDSLHDGELAEREEVPFVALATTFATERFALRFPGVSVLNRFGELPQLFGSAHERAAVRAIVSAGAA